MRYLIYLVLVVSTSLNAGTIHKWTDENGNVHYGDTPPVKTKSENVRVQTAPSNPGKPLPRLSNSDPDGKAAGNTDQQISKDQAERYCNEARADLNVINNSSRIRVKQSDGTERYLSDAEIAKRKAESEAAVDRFCN